MGSRIKILLVPTKTHTSQGPSDNKERNLLLLPKTMMVRELKEAKRGCQLVVLATNEELAKHRSEIKLLLSEFADVIPEELLPGRPPLRSIQYCINFILGVVIPNKAAYCMSPREHEGF